MDTNIIYCGDCKEVLKKIPDESIDLIYLDPPFFSQKHYENFWAMGEGDSETKLSFSDKDWHKLKDSIDPNILREYEHIDQRWKGGHSKGIHVYIAYMRERLDQCERVLKKTGSIFIHCDWHASHYLKQMMDELFGYEHLVNEIIWCYETGGRATKFFPRKHDTIFWYSKTNNYNFYYDSVALPRDTSTMHEPILTDKKGRKYQRNIKGGKEYRYYLDKGVLPNDWWIDIQAINPSAKERLGYPTQKPEALLNRIIEASSKPTDIILDPFCGCGTTLAIAKRLGRQFIGIDLSRIACDVVKKRLGGNVKVIGGESKEELSKIEPHEFARLVIVEKMGGIENSRKSGDMGIDGWIDFKTIPVQVKRWEHKVGRPEIDKFAHAIERDRKEKGILVADDFSKDCYAEVARIEKDKKIKIELRKIDDIFFKA